MVNWYDFDGLVNFGISVVANAAARNALTNSEGRMVFQADTDEVYYNTGSGWVVFGGSPTGTDNLTFTINEDNTGGAIEETALIFEGGTSPDGKITHQTDGNMKFTVASGKAFVFETV